MFVSNSDGLQPNSKLYWERLEGTRKAVTRFDEVPGLAVVDQDDGAWMLPGGRECLGMARLH